MARQDVQGLVTFEEPPISVGDEAVPLSRPALVRILQHMKAVLDGATDFTGLKIWKSYRGVPLFMAEISGELMVYAVESQDGRPPPLKISVMFAGVRRLGSTAGKSPWDGSDDDGLWSGIVLPRRQRHFS
jgi:hypothetical protein